MDWDFVTATPESQGISSQNILRFLDKLNSKKVRMHGFLLLRGGKLLAEGYWKPFHRDRLHRIYSISKSFVSVAIGLLESEGKLSINDRLSDHFPEKLPLPAILPSFKTDKGMAQGNYVSPVWMKKEETVTGAKVFSAARGNLFQRHFLSQKTQFC